MKFSHGSLYLLCLLFAVLTTGWAAADSAPPLHQSKVWQVEKPYDHSEVLTAVLSGKTYYKGKSGEARLEIGCVFDSPTRIRIPLALEVPAHRLDFNTNDYEGPDASTSGPLRMITGQRAPVSYQVAGWISARSRQEDGWIFGFGATADIPEMRYWLTESAHGQRVTLTLPSTVENDDPLTAEFVLPDDDSGLRKVIGPCLKASRSIDN